MVVPLPVLALMLWYAGLTTAPYNFSAPCDKREMTSDSDATWMAEITSAKRGEIKKTTYASSRELQPK